MDKRGARMWAEVTSLINNIRIKDVI